MWNNTMNKKAKLSIPDFEKDIHERFNQDQTLYVHLAPHTHDDVGWVKTIDQYFSGTNEEVFQGSVKNIIEGVI